MSKYYLHYNSDTGEVISVSNEQAVDMLSVELDADTASDFMNGAKKFLHYFVDINSKTLNYKLSDNTVSSNGITILDKFSKTGKIKIQWLENHGWKILSEKDIQPFDFYISYKNLNLLVRKITATTDNLNQLIPFGNDLENDIDNIIISKKTTNIKYGFLIWRPNDN
jgi:hypothetical protein